MEPGFGWSDRREPGSESLRLIDKEPRVYNTKLNASTNVVLLFRLQELKGLGTVNYLLAILTLIYLGLNVVMLVVNYLHGDGNCDSAKTKTVYEPRCGSPVSDYAFHMTEFWATAIYAIVEAFALVYTPRALSSVYDRPLLLKVVVFFDIVAALVPALLVTAALERFEVCAHEIEYLNEFTMSFVDLVLLASLVRRSNARSKSAGRAPYFQDLENLLNVGIALLSTCIAVLQVGIYNFAAADAETAAHYCEFTFAILSAFITFAFCMDNKAAADEEMNAIMYGNHRDCESCTSRASELRGEIRARRCKTETARLGPLGPSKIPGSRSRADSRRDARRICDSVAGPFDGSRARGGPKRVRCGPFAAPETAPVSSRIFSKGGLEASKGGPCSTQDGGPVRARESDGGRRGVRRGPL
ncbi:hypothetical protein M885DRAFT_275723 [Pelagophyceae sp. CCMP2097]|nr:hypothetical protein M885DRAFT_275723 [Pelagophyceae sp. CCMP2097]